MNYNSNNNEWFYKNYMKIITFIEIISSGHPCIADISHDSKPLEKFLMACVNVPVHNLLKVIFLITNI